MPLKPGKEKRLVFAVIKFRDNEPAARSRAHFVVCERVAGNNRAGKSRCLAAFELFEVLAVYEAAIQIPVLQTAMELVSPAFHDAGELSAGAVSEFGGQSCRVHFEFLNHVERSRHDGIEVIRISQNRFLRVYAVYRETKRALPLPDGMLAVHDVHAGHVKVDAIEGLLKHRHFDDRLAFEDLAAGCRLRLEQWRGARNLYGLRNISDLELDVNPRLLAGA